MRLLRRKTEDPVIAEDGIARNTWFALAAQAATATFTAILAIFLVRRLGPEEYGVFSLAFGIGALLVLPADLGISPATARFIAERGRRKGHASAVLAEGLRLKLISSSVICLALFASAGLIASAYSEPDLTWPLRGIAIAVFGQSMLSFYGGAFTALRRTSLTLRAVASEGAVEAGASIVLVLLGTGATGAAFGRAIGYSVGAAIAVVLAVRLLGSASLRRQDPGSSEFSRQIVGYAGVLFIVDGAYTLFGQIDVLIIGAVLSATAVGLFQAPLRLTALLSYPGLAVAAGVAPRLARRRDAEPDREAFVTAIRGMTVLQAAIVVPLVVWATPITDLVLGDAYSESADVLRALGPYAFLIGFAPLVSNAADFLGAARRRVPIAIATVTLNIVIDLVLIPDIGIVGGAIGTDAAFLIYVPAHLWICHGELDLPLRALGKTLLKAGLAAAAAAAVLLAIGTESLSAAQWAAGLLGGSACYLGVLFATRELTRAEIARARGHFGGGASGA